MNNITPNFIATLPKADIHVHAETTARVDRIFARRTGRQPYDWASWTRRVQQDTAPGMPRLLQMGAYPLLDPDDIKAADSDPDFVIERIADILAEGASDGALLIEVIFGAGTIFLPHLG
ncbi:hypothetical protein KFU94_60660 [Chloroflexi bacterium TSY]|nr:hypothetical protein [Chloroflexi bacterium TSY]